MTFVPFWPKFYLRPRDFRSSAWIKIIIRLAMFAKGPCSKRFSDTRCEANISEYLLSSACFAKNSLVDFIRLHASLKTMTFLPETKFFSLYRKRPVYVYSAIQTYIPTLSLFPHHSHGNSSLFLSRLKGGVKYSRSIEHSSFENKTKWKITNVTVIELRAKILFPRFISFDRE